MTHGTGFTARYSSFATVIPVTSAIGGVNIALHDLVALESETLGKRIA
jgi:hypothetical protein